MKRLHKKIGVGVLVAGLILGGVGVSGGSVAHADYEKQYKEELFNHEQQKILRIVDGLGDRMGFEIVEAVDFSNGGKKLELDRGKIKSELDIYKLEDLKSQISEKKSKHSFLKLKFDKSKLQILIVVYK